MKIVEITDVVETILRYLKSPGLYPPDKSGVKGKVTYGIVVYVVVEILFVMALSWHNWDFNARVTALENLNLAVGILNLATEPKLLPDRTAYQVRLMSSKPMLYNLTSSDQLISIYKEKEEYAREMENKSI
ncbi:hypothetical protein LSTR_LSTR004999 [Laodelphax striatellus]|uniref:Uncharacterized protein n=1 Tax=Laodelphax striatellus TaxID=195883 RepID=A0A482XJ60_LAOST|nr:hypothetical protein LSTR_LSTR004999 [Laodelphax striatellus]